MCDTGEDTTERKGFTNHWGSFTVSGKKSDSRAGHGSAGAGCPGHRHWVCRDTLTLWLPAQVPAAVSAGAGDHTLPDLLTRPHSQIITSHVQSLFVYLLCMCYWGTSPQQSELRARDFRLDRLEGNTDILSEHLTSWVCRGAQFTIL